VSFWLEQVQLAWPDYLESCMGLDLPMAYGTDSLEDCKGLDLPMANGIIFSLVIATQ